MSTEDPSQNFRLLVLSSTIAQDGKIALEIAQEAKQLAKTNCCEVMHFESDLILARAHAKLGQPERTLAVFSPCIQFFANSRNQLDSIGNELFMSVFKVVMWVTRQFRCISLGQIESIYDQFKDCSLQMGYSLRTYYFKRECLALDIGELDKAIGYREELLKHPRDEISDCAACEQNSFVEVAARTNQFDQCLAHAKPILSGSMKCGEVPGVTYGWTLKAFSRMGDIASADRYHKSGYEFLKSSQRFLCELAPHLAYLVHRKRWDEAISLFQNHLHWTTDTFQELMLLKFFYAVRELIAHCPEERICGEFPNWTRIMSDGESTHPFPEYLDRQIAELANGFDARNGNNFCSQELPLIYRYDS